jgi:xanthine dehydrogenase small subunit
MTPSRPIRFVHRGRITEVHAADPRRSVLDWLREDARCTGTKEGCNEGDCGACTVVLAERGADGALDWQPVNACIRLLPTLDGRALFTVEDLSGPGAPLHPVQQALVDAHASQCGFCTPGFVMSLWALWQRHQQQHRQRRPGAQDRLDPGPLAPSAGLEALADPTGPGVPAPSRAALADALAGNLCRCTGYRPILDAAERLFTSAAALAAQPAAAPPLDGQELQELLDALAQDPPLALDAAAVPYHAPRDLAAFAALRATHPAARVLAGSTDIGLWINKQFRPLHDGLIFIGEVAELRRIEVDGQVLRIGAAASLEAGWQALASHWPALREMGLRFAGPPTRVAGTLGGNVVNGSPIGDAAPVLMALGAVLWLQRGETTRRLSLDTFYTGYMANQLEPGEFLRAIEVPLPDRAPSCGATGWQVRAYKLSKRHDCDISAVACGLAVRLEGTQVAEVRLAFGGMAAVVQRAARAEAALRRRDWDEAALAGAQAALAEDFQPISDLRASAGYRLRAAQGLLRRFWLETRPVDPLPAAAVNVRAFGSDAAPGPGALLLEPSP